MRIGLLIYGALQTITGGYIYDRTLVAYLRRAGDEVHVLSLPWRSYVDHLFYNLSRTIIQRIYELELDILLEDELNHPSCIILNQHLKNGKHPPVVSIVHHLRLEEDKRRNQTLQAWIERGYLRGVDGFVFNSKTTASSVFKHTNHKPSVIAYPGKERLSSFMTRREIYRRSAKNGPLRIVFLGNIVPRKDLSTLIHALASIPVHDWILTVIGSLDRDRKHSEAILELVRLYGLNDNVIFTNHVSDAEVTAHLQESHVLAVPSRYEGFGMAYAEAMGFGLPAIGTTAGAAGEIIEHGVNGFLIAPGDVLALNGHIRHLDNDRRSLKHMSENCLGRYRQLPDWQETGGKIRAFLRKMVNQQPFM